MSDMNEYDFLQTKNENQEIYSSGISYHSNYSGYDSMRAEFEQNGVDLEIADSEEPIYECPFQNKKYCSFCKNNKEHYSVYSSHALKDSYGKISCPILRNYTCPLCFCTGDNAHTLNYCSLKNYGKYLSLGKASIRKTATRKNNNKKK